MHYGASELLYSVLARVLSMEHKDMIIPKTVNVKINQNIIPTVEVEADR